MSDSRILAKLQETEEGRSILSIIDEIQENSEAPIHAIFTLQEDGTLALRITTQPPASQPATQIDPVLAPDKLDEKKPAADPIDEQEEKNRFKY